MRLLQFLTFIFALGIFFLVPKANAAALDFEQIDYGDPNDPFANPVLPGQTGDVYFTIKNNTSTTIRQLEMLPRNGRCVEQITGDLQKEEVLAGESFRFGPLSITMRADCERSSDAAILFVGTYRDSIDQINRTWIDIPFQVAPFPTVHFVDNNIGIPINDNRTSVYNFTINSSLRIQDVTVSINIEHTYIGDLQVRLIHVPSNTSVVLHNYTGGGTNDLIETYGRGGTAIPALNSLNGVTASGAWKLEVKDDAGGDQGVIRGLELHLYAN